MRSNTGKVSEIVNMWKTTESPDFHYYEKFDNSASTDPFWVNGGPFQTQFAKLNLGQTLEIACGTGRHSARFVDRVGQLYLLDTSVDGIKVAAKRFHGRPNVKAILSQDGETIPLGNETLTAVFSYDAMVHFEATTIGNYLFETARVLVSGGMALFHHSIYDKNPSGSFRDNPGWRNFMSPSLFAYFASRAGLEIKQAISLDERDGLTLMRKP